MPQSKLSVYRMIEVWKSKSKHLNQDNETLSAINAWLTELLRMETEDDYVAEQEALARHEDKEWQDSDSDIPF